jgi:hypothetical protein
MVMRNGQAYINGSEAVQQAIATRLRLLTYEWWEDYPTGTPWWQDIIATRGIEEAKRIIRKRIANTEHVRSVLSLDADWNNETRHLVVNCTVLSDYGEFTMENLDFNSLE